MIFAFNEKLCFVALRLFHSQADRNALFFHFREKLTGPKLFDKGEKRTSTATRQRARGRFSLTFCQLSPQVIFPEENCTKYPSFFDKINMKIFFTVYYLVSRVSLLCLPSLSSTTREEKEREPGNKVGLLNPDSILGHFKAPPPPPPT